MDEKSLPPAYDNLNYDVESDNAAFAPGAEGDSELEGTREVFKVPSAPILEFSETPRTLIYNPPTLVYEDVYEACIEYVKATCCYGSKFVKQMVLSEISNGGAYHYILESFGEKRESMTSVTPFYGQQLDGPENGPAPGPWDIVVHPPALFKDAKAKLEIPHTAYAKPCDKCVGNGRVRCESCSGRGGSSCTSCFGSGRNSGRSCTSCHGSGRRRCWNCHGRGQVKCKRCNGHGNIKICMMLIVTWTNHPDEFVSNVSGLPSDRIKKVTGSKMLFEELERVSPVINAPDDSVNAASRRLVEKHYRSFPNEQIIKQRHVLRVVPLTKVLYEWKGKRGEFYVYGQEKKVYFEEYPQKCCCCTCL